MQQTFTFLGMTGHLYGLYAAIATLVLLTLMGILGYLRRLPMGTVRVFGVLGIVLGIFCARLVFCLLNIPLFVETYENSLLMLRFWDGGLSMTGLLLGLVLAAFFTARIMKVSFSSLMDVLTVPLGLFIAILRWAEGYTELGVGKVVDGNALTAAMPWLVLTETMGTATEYRMAVYRYEALAGLLIFLCMLVLALRKKSQKNARPGDTALIFFSLYGASQMLLESMRDDGHLLIIFLRMAQVAAALMPVIATWVFSRRYVSIRGKADRRIVLSWVLVALCIGIGILLEFSLDGRFTWGTPSMLRDYLIMAVVCAVLFVVPYSLFTTLRKRVYGEGNISASVEGKTAS